MRADAQRGTVEILRDADLAMYEAKATGRATSHFRELHSGSTTKQSHYYVEVPRTDSSGLTPTTRRRLERGEVVIDSEAALFMDISNYP